MNENEPDRTQDDLRAVLAELTTDQIRFVVARNEFSSDKDAAEALDISPQTVKHWKYTGAPIDEAVRLMVLDGIVVASELRRRHLAKAMAVKVKGLESNSERVRQGVSTEIIEWEMGKATQRQEVMGKDGGDLVVRLTWGDNDDDTAAGPA